MSKKDDLVPRPAKLTPVNGVNKLAEPLLFFKTNEESIKQAAPIPEQVFVEKAIDVAGKVIDNLVDQKEMDVATFSNAAGSLRDYVLEQMENDPLLDGKDAKRKNPFRQQNVTLKSRLNNMIRCMKK